jgi:Pectate lyase superfamily protein
MGVRLAGARFDDEVIDAREEFGAVGDGIADDTDALQTAIERSVGQVLHIPRGKYRISDTLYITSRLTRIIGEVGTRASLGGTELAFYGSGACIQIGADDGEPYDDGDYDGLQDQWFEHIYLSAGVRSTPLELSATVGNYQAGTSGIRDWRGGGLRLRDVGFEGFDWSFWGIQSDISTFEDIISVYSHQGLYFGPRSDQVTLARLYSFFCDQALDLDRANEFRLEDAQIVGCGHATRCPINIRKGTSGTRITRCWFEKFGTPAYNGVDQAGFIAAGIDDGYGPSGVGTTTTPATGISVTEPFVYTPAVGLAGHARCIVRLGAATRVEITSPATMVGASLSNLDAMVLAPGGTAYTNAQAGAAVRNAGSGGPMTKLFLNEGSGSPDFCAFTDGPNGLHLSAVNARLTLNRIGAGAGADQIYLSTEALAGGVFVVAPNYASGPTQRLGLTRSIRHAAAIPTTGLHQVGDLIFYTAPTAGGKIGAVCVAGGNPGTWKEWGAIDA